MVPWSANAALPGALRGVLPHVCGSMDGSPLRKLLWEIADCSELRRCREEPDVAHPCQAISDLQADEPWDRHQRPEPWNGHLETAPILFVSSNPSIDRSEPYPWE